MRKPPKMYKRHYELIARALREAKATPEQVQVFATALHPTGEFKEWRFLEAALPAEVRA